MQVDSILGVRVDVSVGICVDSSGFIVGIGYSNGVYLTACSATSSCVVVATVDFIAGNVTDVRSLMHWRRYSRGFAQCAVDAHGVLWLATTNGLAVVTPAGAVEWAVAGAVMTAVSISTDDTAPVAATSLSKLFLLNADSAEIERWEWITRVSDAAGGPIDDVVQDMAFDSCGALWMATGMILPLSSVCSCIFPDSCIDVMLPDRSIFRVTGLSGLPINFSTSISGEHIYGVALARRSESDVADGARNGVMWIGTADGVLQYTADQGCFAQVFLCASRASWSAFVS